MPWIDIRGTRIHYQILNPHGEQTVVMLHGLFSNHTVFHACGAKSLADQGFRVILYDMRGHGLSEVAPTGYGLDELVFDLLDLLDDLAVDCADLVGYSFGAAEAIYATQVFPERVRSLTLIEPFGLGSTVIDEVAETNDITQGLMQYSTSTGVPLSSRQATQAKEQIRRVLDSGLVDALRHDADFFDKTDLESIDKPVLILSGWSSPYLADGKLLASRLAHATYRTTPGDHNLPVTRSDWVKAALLAFLAPNAKTHAQDNEKLDRSGQGIAIRVRDLTFSYGKVKAVNGISFDVEQGAFFAFLGVNGAGKSTTINCLTTLLHPQRGSAQVAGHTLGKDDAAIRNSIGVVFQGALLDPRFSVEENLHLRARFHRLTATQRKARLSELISLLDMGSFANRQYRRLSGGQKRRADIARALIHRPSLLFLDEPTAGLDPHSREQVWDAIRDVREHEGMTVFLTTHYMEETERADMVCVIDAGHIVAQDSPARLREQYSTSELSLRLCDDAPSLEPLRELFPDIVPESHARDPLRLPVTSTYEAQRILYTVWEDLDDFEYRHGSMDDVFLALTGHGCES